MLEIKLIVLDYVSSLFYNEVNTVNSVLLLKRT